MRPDSAGWSSLVARRAHNPEVGGSNPPPATKRYGPDLVKQVRAFVYVGNADTLPTEILARSQKSARKAADVRKQLSTSLRSAAAESQKALLCVYNQLPGLLPSAPGFL